MSDDDSYDSPAVRALIAKRDSICSDWSGKRKRITAEIRAQRLSEARARGTHTDEEWNAMLAEFEYRCAKCGCLPEGRPCKDHVIPIAMEGSDAIGNLQPLCRECNTGKRWDTFNWAQYRREHGFSQERE